MLMSESLRFNRFIQTDDSPRNIWLLMSESLNHLSNRFVQMAEPIVLLLIGQVVVKNWEIFICLFGYIILIHLKVCNNNKKKECAYQNWT